jgi:lipid-binding SYLF domain-containing protein
VVSSEPAALSTTRPSANEREATKLEAEAKATLAEFQADTKGAEEVFANAKGVLVCPKITKGASHPG